jgi:zeaxanthin glucosyltransferase
MVTMGRALQRQGHRVTVFQISEMRDRIEAEQLEFRPLGENSIHAGEIARAVTEIGRRSSLSALRFTLDCSRRLASVICEYAPAAVRSAAVDLLLVDDNEPAGGSVAEHLGLPYGQPWANPVTSRACRAPAVCSLEL